MKQHLLAIVGITTMALVNCDAAVAKTKTQKTKGIDRTVLPIAEPEAKPIAEFDVRNATPPPRFEVKAPAGSPNVLLVLLDDLGFAGTSTFGGPVATPTFERIANEGLRYNNFHTNALCSPTRAAIKRSGPICLNSKSGI